MSLSRSSCKNLLHQSVSHEQSSGDQSCYTNGIFGGVRVPVGLTTRERAPLLQFCASLDSKGTSTPREAQVSSWGWHACGAAEWYTSAPGGALLPGLLEIARCSVATIGIPSDSSAAMCSRFRVALKGRCRPHRGGQILSELAVLFA